MAEVEREDIFENAPKRTLLEIDLEILKFTRNSRRLTAIMYQTRINCTSLKNRLRELENKGFLTSQRIKKRGTKLSANPSFGRGIIYTTTVKGMELVSLWLKIKDLYYSGINRNSK